MPDTLLGPLERAKFIHRTCLFLHGKYSSQVKQLLDYLNMVRESLINEEQRKILEEN
jgi:hypothetical protein